MYLILGTIMRACEMGNKDVVKLLIENNADGRIHPVTRYSPLYISCFKGWVDVVDILLKVNFSLDQLYRRDFYYLLNRLILDRNSRILFNNVPLKNGYQFMQLVLMVTLIFWRCY